MSKAAAVLVLFIFSGQYLGADPLLSRPEIVGGKILIFPDHQEANVYYYVPTQLMLAHAFGKPQFFFYKYVYVKPTASDASQTIAGGVLTLTVEFGNETKTLQALKGQGFEYRPVPIERLTCILSYTPIEGETQNTDKEELAEKTIPWSKKNFTMTLGRESATYLWKIFEEKKTVGLSVDCQFYFSGYEQTEGKLQEADRSERLSLAVPVSMESDADLFKVINLADKFSFNYRRMSVLCFDFINKVNSDLAKVTAEIEVLTAKNQRDNRTVSFTAQSEPQQDLEFNIPEAKGGKYRYRVNRIYADGRSITEGWKDGDSAFLDLSTYNIAVKDEESQRGACNEN